MVSLTGRKADRGNAPEQLVSRLLPNMLDEKRLASIGTLSILDFGRANSQSLEFFNQFSCRLSVLDAADSLTEWSAQLVERLEEPPSMQQMQLELSGLLDTLAAQRFDLVFLWDTLNHLHEYALPAFAGLLRRHVTANFRGHGFLLQKRSAEPMLRHMSVAGLDRIVVREQQQAIQYAHNRRVVNESLGSDLKIDHGVLHSDGRLEFLLVSGKASGRHESTP
ncbi:MAG: hypothetical protein AB8B57_00820 [Congregibacter sp.]